MQVLNIQDLVDQQFGKCKIFKKNHPLSPQQDNETLGFRMCVSGSSGCGKTNLVLSMIMSGQISWDHIYLYTTTPEQPKIKLFLQWINTLQKAYKDQYGNDISLVTIGTSTDEIVQLSDVPNNRMNLVLFDDMLLEKDQSLIENYYVKSRHRCVSCIMIGQNFSKIPITVRRNSDYFAIFKPATKTDVDTLTAQLNLFDTKQLFKKALGLATEGKSFMLIDRKTEIDLLKIRKGWDQVWDHDNEEFIPIDELVKLN